MSSSSDPKLCRIPELTLSSINYAQISDTVCFGGIQSDAGIGFSIFGGEKKT